MAWWQFALLGAGGGAIMEALTLFRAVLIWQDARQSAIARRKRSPKLTGYIDVPAHALLLFTRMSLSAATAVTFGITGQVTGSYGAVAIGIGAPIVLAQLGSIPQISKAIGDSSERQSQINAEAERLAEIRKANSGEIKPRGISSDAASLLAARREVLARELRIVESTDEGGVAR